MARLGEIIRAHHDTIFESWLRQAQQAAAARGLDRPEFANLIPTYLRSLAASASELGECEGERRELVEHHISSRVRQGFRLSEIVEEFALLGRCVAATWSEDESVEPPERAEIEQLFLELHRTSAIVTEIFTRHMMEDEQTEKQYLRLIQTVAREALQPDAPALQARLKEILALVMEATGAQSTALLLYDATASTLELVASVGAADEALEHYVTSLASSSFAGAVAGREESTFEWDAGTTELEITDALRKSGIHSLLGVRLPRRHTLVGVMYIGVTERRKFTAREMGRLESLGQQLTVHLDNAKLYAELKAHVARLDDERELRERFVSVLAHDLRGPLSAAKVSAQLLMRRPERLDERRDLAIKIDRNIERTDRMIRDLLDANRIRAGERLPLRIDECDLRTVAEEVFEELTATFGERFALEATRIVGFWSADELRRALWNLGSNAIKYGAGDRPVTLRVQRTEVGAALSVHNWGTPISPEDQRRLFRPFSRLLVAQTGVQRGWGLGLTLVHGCADAHGGRVVVESNEAAGTTFAIELPLDARPFQPRVGEPAPARPAAMYDPPTLH